MKIRLRKAVRLKKQPAFLASAIEKSHLSYILYAILIREHFITS